MSRTLPRFRTRGHRSALTLTAAVVAGLVALSSTGACGGPAPAPPASSAPATPVVPSAAPPRPSSPAESPVRPPSQQDETFVNALSRNNLSPGNPAQASQVGHAVCQELDANTPIDTLVTDVQNVAQTSLQDTGYIIGAATGVYCPNNLAKLPRN